MKRKILGIVASIALIVPLGVGVALPASAAPQGSISSGQFVSAASPSCVKVLKTGRTSWGWKYAKIRNDCRSSQRVKVVWAYAPDSECFTLSSGKTKKHETGMAGKFDGLEKC